MDKTVRIEIAGPPFTYCRKIASIIKEALNKQFPVYWYDEEEGITYGSKNDAVHLSIRQTPRVVIPDSS